MLLWDICADVYRDIFTGRRNLVNFIIRGELALNYALTLATALCLQSRAGLSAAKTILDLVRR